MNIDPTIFFICNDAERALGLESFSPNFHIVCIDDNPIIDYITKNGGKVFCLERELGKKNPIFRNSYKLLSNKLVQEYIKKNTPEAEAPKVMFFKIAPNIEKLCENLGYWIVNTSSLLNKKFEMKISQYEELKNAGVNFPMTIVDKLKNFSYESLVADLGKHFVIQYDRGHTGSSTVFIENKEEFEEEKSLFPERIARVATKIEGNAWTINACVTRFGILYGGLSYQITGISELTKNEGGTVGNDWNYLKNLSDFTIEQVKGITEKVGKVMRKSGFKGLFGLDFVIDKNGEVFLIEVNARQPASTSMHTKLMFQQKLIPLQFFHITEFLFEDDDRFLDFIDSVHKDIVGENADLDGIGLKSENQIIKYLEFQNQEAIKPISAAQIFLRNTSDKEIVIKNSFLPGIYKIEDGLRRIRDGYSISDVENEEEFQILAQSKNMEVSSGSEVARIQVRKGAIDEEGNLENWVVETLANINKSLLS